MPRLLLVARKAGRSPRGEDVRVAETSWQSRTATSATYCGRACSRGEAVVSYRDKKRADTGTLPPQRSVASTVPALSSPWW